MFEGSFEIPLFVLVFLSFFGTVILLMDGKDGFSWWASAVIAALPLLASSSPTSHPVSFSALALVFYIVLGVGCELGLLNLFRFVARSFKLPGRHIRQNTQLDPPD